MNKTIFLTCAIITTLAVTIVLPGLSYAHAFQMLRPGLSITAGGGSVDVGGGSVDVNVRGLGVHASHCGGVSIGSSNVLGSAAIACRILPASK
jgi:hypothetical protein